MVLDQRLLGSGPNPWSSILAAMATTNAPNSHSQTPESPDSPPTDSGSGQDSEQEPEDPKQGDDEEEAECGFCLFMKGGGCKEEFVAWEKCVEEAEKKGDDVAEKCFEVTSLLKKCMEAHADYYEPILSAEKAMMDSVAAESGSDQAPESQKDSVLASASQPES